MLQTQELQIYVGRMPVPYAEAGNEYGCFFGPLENPRRYGADVEVSYDHLVGLVRGLMLGRGGVIRIWNGLAEPVAIDRLATLIRLEKVPNETLDDLLVKIGWLLVPKESS